MNIFYKILKKLEKIHSMDEEKVWLQAQQDSKVKLDVQNLIVFEPCNNYWHYILYILLQHCGIGRDQM